MKTKIIFSEKEIDHNGHISYAHLSTDVCKQPINKSVELLKNMYSMRDTDEWRPYEKQKEILDESGSIHKYFQQYYKNVKVEHGTVSVHSDNQGNIERIFGYFKQVGEVEINPKFSQDEALKYAMKHIGAEVYKWQIPEEEKWIKEFFNDTYHPVGELVIVKDRLKTDEIYRLAYRFDIYAHKPMSRDYVWVDAITGDIIDTITRIMFANAIGTAQTRYSGQRTITTDSFNGSFRLRETRNNVNISTFNMNHTGNYTTTDFTDNDNNWTTIEHQTNNNNAGLDAHWGAEMVYEYFRQLHLRNSWDNNNGALISYVNGNLIVLGFNNSDNAFWNGNFMTYGQGTSWPPVVTLDICAHEIAHGICQSTANLVYQGESGAINESLSDIWGACVENWATTNKQTWLIGEDLGTAIRSMSNPGLFNQPNTYGAGPNWWNPNNLSWDNGGVHRNSGVMNYWFYLLSVGGNGTNDNGNAYNVTGIGINKAAKIVYRAETVNMLNLPNLTFANARNVMIAAAEYLYQSISPEVVAVHNAWHAVGIGNRLVISGPTTVNKGSTNIWELPFVSGAIYSWSSVYMTAWGPTNGYTVAFTATNSQNNDIVECTVTLNGVTTFFDKFISVV